MTKGINDLKYDYYPVEGMPPNVLAEETKNTSGITYRAWKADSPLDETLHELAKKRPAWKFVSPYGYPRGAGSNLLRRFDVYEQGQYLGYLMHESVWRNDGNGYRDVVQYSNDRMAKALRRKAYATTTDHRKAVKDILACFYVESFSERMAKATSDITGRVAVMPNNRRAMVDHCIDAPLYYNDNPLLRKFLAANIDQLLEFVRAYEAEHGNVPHFSRERVAVLPTRVQEWEESIPIADALKTGGWYILTRDGGYDVVVRHNSTTTSWSLTDDHLPDDVRSKLGMLKLVAPNTLVAGAGMRTHEDKFFVMTKEAPLGERSMYDNQ